MTGLDFVIYTFEFIDGIFVIIEDSKVVEW